jgi:hypothetical protein
MNRAATVVSIVAFGGVAYGAGRLVGPLLRSEVIGASVRQTAVAQDRPGPGTRTSEPSPTVRSQDVPLEAEASKPIKLPKVGSFDEAIIAGDSALGMVRDAVHRLLLLRIGRCQKLGQSGSTVVFVTVAVRATDGVAHIEGVKEISIDAGAPLASEVDRCVRRVFAVDELLAPSPLPPETPPEQKAKYSGRWRGAGTRAGTFVFSISFSDRCAANVKSTSTQ